MENHNANGNTYYRFKIAMENGPYIVDFPIETSISSGFPSATFNYRRVIPMDSAEPLDNHWNLQ